MPGAFTPCDSLGPRCHRALAPARPNSRATHLEGSRRGGPRGRPRRSAGRSGWPPAPSAPQGAAGTPGGSAADSGPSGWSRSLRESRAVSTASRRNRPVRQPGPQHAPGSGAKGHNRCLRSASEKKIISAEERGSADEDHGGDKIKYGNGNGNRSALVKTKIQRSVTCYLKDLFSTTTTKTRVIQKRRSRRRTGRTLRKHTVGRGCLPVGPGAGFSTQKLQNSHFTCVQMNETTKTTTRV